jgi:hypothetical protein
LWRSQRSESGQILEMNWLPESRRPEKSLVTGFVHAAPTVIATFEVS